MHLAFSPHSGDSLTATFIPLFHHFHLMPSLHTLPRLSYHDDMIARLSLPSMRRLKDQMLWAFAHCPLPKWEVLGASAVDALMRCAAAAVERGKEEMGWRCETDAVGERKRCQTDAVGERRDRWVGVNASQSIKASARILDGVQPTSCKPH
jgi:hypothetical protein